MFNLKKAIEAKRKGLSDAALAKKIGVSIIALRGALAGRQQYQKTAKKYARFLGVAPGSLVEQLGKVKRVARKAKPGRKAKKSK
jgi:transcriptional regulator with XRE-family HTH domain